MCELDARVLEEEELMKEEEDGPSSRARH
jgi:hypothetical protein